ncbi:hypothetical protein ASD39_10380 [Sphingomonas sp. Root50]|nr:hypothetical protein ASD17_10320 [Sphingomonas sp. Root1294]KQY67502.1 hypothetical protein ASD39_10380 [Sphingomonas sp. Root50]KRB90879.1 hypothetical protein ASE22_11385 [Sphingomonas sp. Root720]
MSGRSPQFYCIGHKPPAFTPRCDYLHISPNRFDGLNQMIVPDDALGDKYHGSVLSEFTQLFALGELLKDSPPDDYFYMFQYRKFVALKRGAQTASNMPYACASPAEEADGLFPSPEDLAALDGRLLTVPALKIQSIARNYARFHLTEDFAAFVISLRGSGHFDDRRCRNFINCGILYPSSSLGLHQIGIFLRHMAIMKTVWSHFADNFHEKREGLQRRSGGFLLERLQSFLMYEEIDVHRTIAARQGHLTVLSETPVIRVTA